MTKTIALTSRADPAAVLDVARRALAPQGYLWLRTGAVTAQAHEGGRKITRVALSAKLLIDLDVRAGGLVLHQRTAGWGLPFVAIRLSREFRRVHRSIAQALDAADLSG